VKFRDALAQEFSEALGKPGERASSFKVAGVLLVGLGTIYGIWSAVGDKRPVGTFFEAFVAFVLWVIVPFGVLFLAAMFGSATLDSTKSKLFAWIIGISVFLVAGGIFYGGALNIPGVGWRVNQMSSSGDDY
jgi:hypothetical protein